MYHKIHAKYKVSDLDKFALVTVHTNDSENEYSLIFAFVPKINQIELIAKNFKGSWNNDLTKYRTTFEKLDSIYSVPITKRIIMLKQALEIFPKLSELEIIVGHKKNYREINAEKLHRYR